MATDVITIPFDNSTEPGTNFELLREEGIALLQQLAGQIWTDFNTHDPGVTILEALCYAITDLGYRTEFGIEDLVAPDNSGSAPPLKNFYTLADAATMCALTINDFRKLLVDLPGVRNAWLEKSTENEVPIFLDAANKTLTYTDGFPQLTIGGLINVLLEFEEDDKWGNLNDNSLITPMTLNLSTGPLQMDIEFEFPVWEDIDAAFDAAAPSTVTLISYDARDGFNAIVEFDVDTLPDNIFVNVRAVSNLDQVTSLADFHSDLQTKLGSASEVLATFDTFYQKRAYVIELVKGIRKYLVGHRNLCEDFYAIQPMNIQEIGLCLELEVSPEADTDQVLAEVYYQTELFLSPPVRFHSIRDLLAKGKTTDEIFNGPILQHGFIDEDELRLHQRRRVIYTSDLVQIYMDIPGVVAVNKLLLSNYVKGVAIGEDAVDCLMLTAPERFLPRLSFRRSDVRFDKGDNVARAANEGKAQQLLSELKALDGARRNDQTPLDMEIPYGTHLAIDAYHSVQEEFPLVYGVGSEGLSAQEPALRHAQARQLKGFLLFFEQLIANYLSQLANIRAFYALEEPAGNRTYFAKTLYNVPEVQNLIKDFVDTYGVSWSDSDWTTYIATPSPYIQAVENLIETPEEYVVRRNHFLDHLVARFNESFAEYALWLYARNAPGTGTTFIRDRTAFLSDYKAATAQRAKGYNYCDVDAATIWTSTNVSGLKKRVSRLLGFENYERTHISAIWNYITVQPIGSTGDFEWIYDNGGGVVLLTSIAYNTDPEAEVGACDALNQIHDRNNFVIVDTGSTPDPWQVQLLDGTGTVIATHGLFPDEVTAEDHIRTIMDLLGPIDDTESFHVVEGILMRPEDDTDALLSVFVDPNCDNYPLLEQWNGVERLEGVFPPQYDPKAIPKIQSNKIWGDPLTHSANELDEDGADLICPSCECLKVCDPYSFRICVIVPTWTPRFRDAAFRQLFRKTVRQETPAHIFVSFHFINRKEMRDFETCYEDWLQWRAETTQVELGLLDPNDATTPASLTCMVDGCANMCSRQEAHYEINELRKVNTYAAGDVLAFVVDSDGETVDARLSSSSTLPPGTILNPFNGDIIVEDPEALQKGGSWDFHIITWNSSGERHCLNLQFGFDIDEEARCVPGEDKLLSQYVFGDTLLSFTDANGGVQSISPNPLISPLPPGTAINYSTGAITVSDENLLEAGSWKIQLTTTDALGNTTYHECTITIKGDQPAEGDLMIKCPKNEDCIEDGMLALVITDDDGGVASVTSAPVSWTDIGLDMNIVPGPAFDQAEFRIIDRQRFLDYLRDNDEVVAEEKCHQFTLTLTVTDVLGGTTILVVPFSYRPDDEATVYVDPTKNILNYVPGDPLGQVIDDLDLGIASWSSVEDLLAWGMWADIVVDPNTGLPRLQVEVKDHILFQQRVQKDWTITSAGWTKTFTFKTEDETCGQSTVDLTIVINRDSDPIVDVTPAGPLDGYTTGVAVVTIRHDDSDGIVKVTTDAALTVRGMSLDVEPDSQGGPDLGVLRVADADVFRKALYTHWERDTAGRTFSMVMDFESTNALGGVHTSSATIVVDDFISDTHDSDYETKPAHELGEGTVLLRWQSTSPSQVQVSTGSLPPGTSLKESSYERTLEVSDTHALFPGNYAFMLEGPDVTGTVISAEFSIEIGERELNHVVNLREPQAGLITAAEIYGGLGNVQLISFPDANYGVTQMQGSDIGYLFYGRYTNAGVVSEATFTGVVEDNNNEPVKGTIRFVAVHQPYQPMTGKIYAQYAGELEHVGEEVKDLLASVHAYLGELDDELFENGVIFGDEEVEGAYRRGERDEALFDNIGLMENGAQLRALYDQMMAAEGEDLTMAVEMRVRNALFHVQTRLVTDFAGQFAENDIEKGSFLDRLLDEIQSILFNFESI